MSISWPIEKLLVSDTYNIFVPIKEIEFTVVSNWPYVNISKDAAKNKQLLAFTGF